MVVGGDGIMVITGFKIMINVQNCNCTAGTGNLMAKILGIPYLKDVQLPHIN